MSHTTNDERRHLADPVSHATVLQMQADSQVNVSLSDTENSVEIVQL